MEDSESSAEILTSSTESGVSETQCQYCEQPMCRSYNTWQRSPCCMEHGRKRLVMMEEGNPQRNVVEYSGDEKIFDITVRSGEHLVPVNQTYYNRAVVNWLRGFMNTVMETVVKETGKRNCDVTDEMIYEVMSSDPQMMFDAKRYRDMLVKGNTGDVKVLKLDDSFCYECGITYRMTHRSNHDAIDWGRRMMTQEYWHERFLSVIDLEDCDELYWLAEAACIREFDKMKHRRGGNLPSDPRPYEEPYKVRREMLEDGMCAREGMKSFEDFEACMLSYINCDLEFILSAEAARKVYMKSLYHYYKVNWKVNHGIRGYNRLWEEDSWKFKRLGVRHDEAYIASHLVDLTECKAHELLPYSIPPAKVSELSKDEGASAKSVDLLKDVDTDSGSGRTLKEGEEPEDVFDEEEVPAVKVWVESVLNDDRCVAKRTESNPRTVKRRKRKLVSCTPEGCPVTNRHECDCVDVVPEKRRKRSKKDNAKPRRMRVKRSAVFSDDDSDFDN